MATAETLVYWNKTQSAVIDMVGECLGLNAVAKTCVRKIVGGGFAVVSTTKLKLIKTFDDMACARVYNSVIRK